MSFINYSDKEINFKIVYYGAALSGKTTSLEYIHQRSEGKSTSKLTIDTGNERTLFFDFVPLFLSNVNGYKTRFHLYTVPGQVLYDDSRRLILKGVDGIIFVVDSLVEKMDANLKSLENLKTNLNDEGLAIDRLPIVFQYNKRDMPNTANLEALKKLMNPWEFPSFESVATKGEGVFDAFKEIAKQVVKNQSVE
ncbi:MAG: GTPase domain-containing protein [bacterium]